MSIELTPEEAIRVTAFGLDKPERYPTEILDDDYDDNGTMPENVAALATAVVGHRIVSAEKTRVTSQWGGEQDGLAISLDNGTRVHLADTDDCCAYTDLESFLLHADKIEHVITGVGTTDGYTTWHIYADLGDVLEMKVGWSCGNPFYYGYGFEIAIQESAVSA